MAPQHDITQEALMSFCKENAQRDAHGYTCVVLLLYCLFLFWLDNDWMALMSSRCLGFSSHRQARIIPTAAWHNFKTLEHVQTNTRELHSLFVVKETFKQPFSPSWSGSNDRPWDKANAMKRHTFASFNCMSLLSVFVNKEERLSAR